MRILRAAAVGLIGVTGWTACGSEADDDGSSQVTGEVVLADPESFEPVDGAVLTVQLVDVSLADAAADVLDAQEIDLEDRTFPIPFELSFDPDSIDERNSYAVQARVEADGSLLAINDTSHPAITNGAGTTDIEVVLVVVS